MQDRVLTIPNVLSLLRLLAVPYLGYVVASGDRLFAGILIGVMGWTDFFDGWIARRFNQQSNLGKLLDPIADRLAIVVISIGLVVAGVLPVLMAGIVVARDVLLALAYAVLARRGWGLPEVKYVGKWATAVLLLALPWLVLSGTAEPWRMIGLAIFGVGTVLYWTAFVAYASDAVRFVRGVASR